MVATRGEYTTDTARLVVSAYDVNKRPWSQSAEEWIAAYGNRAWVAGGFAWTGFDYRGEPSPYPKYPSINSHFGVLDTCGFAKDMAWFYRAWWTNEPVLHLMPHWTWPGRDSKPIEVWVLSNMDNVELFLNGHSLGAQPVVRQKHNQWTVPYTPGTLEVRGTRAGKLHFDRTETTGPAAHLHLEPWKPGHSLHNQESTVVNISIVDAQFRLVPDADALVNLRIEGPARIAGVGNGNPTSLEPDIASARKAFHGLCQAILIATGAGDVTLQAESAGLTHASVTINLSIGPAKII
jgi:beta-galactosidase